MPTARAGWLLTACFAALGCNSGDALEPSNSGAAGDGADGAGAMGPLGGGSGAGSGSGGVLPSGGFAATEPGGGAGSSGSGGASAGESGGGIAGTDSGGVGGRGGAAGSSGGTAGAAGGSASAGRAGAAGAAPTFTELWNRTLENGCAVPYCHDGSGKGWSGFDKATAYRTLVGAASTTCPGETRVVAGNPAMSVLAAAISHTDLGACDVPTMPRDRAKLPQADIDRIIAWIQAGARND